MNISQVPALKEHAVGHSAPVTNLDCLIRGKPVSAVGPQGNSLASYGAVSDNVAAVGVAIQITRVPVKETAINRLDQASKFGKRRFRAEIQAVKPAKVRHVNAPTVRGPAAVDAG